MRQRITPLKSRLGRVGIRDHPDLAATRPFACNQLAVHLGHDKKLRDGVVLAFVREVIGPKPSEEGARAHDGAASIERSGERDPTRRLGAEAQRARVLDGVYVRETQGPALVF